MAGLVPAMTNKRSRRFVSFDDLKPSSQSATETRMSTATSPLRKSAEPTTWNFKLLAQNDLGGFGGMGEGMSVQVAKDGRRIIWLAHESAPKNFTAVDVSDPSNPKVVAQTELPKAHMRHNLLKMY